MGVQSDDEWPYGVGQGAPLDDKGRYIYSQIGMPVVPSPGLQAAIDSGLAMVSVPCKPIPSNT